MSRRRNARAACLAERAGGAGSGPTEAIWPGVDGPGHFLGHDQTLGRMQSDYFYPDLADRRTPQDWADQGAPDLLEQARLKTHELLAEPPPQHIPEEIDADIRRRFPIRL